MINIAISNQTIEGITRLLTVENLRFQRQHHQIFGGDSYEPYLEKMKAYIETHSVQFDDDCNFLALDSLYWPYAECHHMSNEKTKQASADLNACLDDLAQTDNNHVFCLVGALCAEHERIAFFDGLRLSDQLMLELQQEEK